MTAHLLVLVGILGCSLNALAVSGPARDWPEAMAIIESLDGEVFLNHRPARKHETFKPEGSTLRVGENGFATLVLSTGLALYCGPGTELEWTAARQAARVSIYAAGEDEMSRSHVVLRLVRGTLGAHQPRPNPASILSLQTLPGEIQSSAESFTVILETAQNLVAALEGKLFFYPASASPRRFVTAGEMLDLAEASRGGSASALKPILANDRQFLGQPALMATRSAERVAYVVEGEEATFRIVRTPSALQGTAYNDHRFPR